MDQLLIAARPIRRSPKTSVSGGSRGDRLDYATLEHAGQAAQGQGHRHREATGPRPPRRDQPAARRAGAADDQPRPTRTTSSVTACRSPPGTARAELEVRRGGGAGAARAGSGSDDRGRRTRLAGIRPAQAPAAVAALDEAAAGQQPEAAQHRVQVHARFGRDRRGPGGTAGGQRVQDPGAVGIELVSAGRRRGAGRLRAAGGAGRSRVGFGRAQRGEHLDDVVGAGDAGGAPLPDDPVAPGRLGRGHRAGDGHQRLAQLGRVPRGVQRAAALARLDDHGAAGQRGDGPVADQEPQPSGLAARRPFADHQAMRGDVANRSAWPAG